MQYVRGFASPELRKQLQMVGSTTSVWKAYLPEERYGAQANVPPQKFLIQIDEAALATALNLGLRDYNGNDIHSSDSLSYAVKKHSLLFSLCRTIIDHPWNFRQTGNLSLWTTWTMCHPMYLRIYPRPFQISSRDLAVSTTTTKWCSSLEHS